MTEDLVDRLTQRERECLRLVDRHLSSKQIARELGMSKTSVDTYCDRARRKLGAGDRYEAARRLADHDRLVLTGSGQDTIRTDTRPKPPLHDVQHGDEQDGRLGKTHTGSETPSRQLQRGRSLSDTGSLNGSPGSSVAARGRGLRDTLADAERQWRAGADFQLGAIGTAASRSDGYTDQGSDGAGFGLGHSQNVGLQTAGNDSTRNPLFDLGLAGRELPARGGIQWGEGLGRHDLSSLAKLGWIGLIAIVSALSFGAVLSGLHALKDLA